MIFVYNQVGLLSVHWKGEGKNSFKTLVQHIYNEYRDGIADPSRVCARLNILQQRTYYQLVKATQDAQLASDAQYQDFLGQQLKKGAGALHKLVSDTTVHPTPAFVAQGLHVPSPARFAVQAAKEWSTTWKVHLADPELPYYRYGETQTSHSGGAVREPSAEDTSQANQVIGEGT